MAEHADPPDAVAETTRPVLPGTRTAIAAGVVIVAAIGGVVGWLGHRDHQAHEIQARHSALVQVARQAAINFTTISYTQAEADVQRILDSATGSFRDDFQQRSQPFIDVVEQAQSSSAGTVTEAGLLSDAGDRAQVLVTVSMKTSTADAPQQPPRGWRLRISLQDVDHTTKVSNVEFVP